MPRETAGQIDAGKQGKRIGKSGRKRESAGQPTDEDKREGKTRTAEKENRQALARKNQTKQAWETACKARRGKIAKARGETKNTKNDAGGFRENAAEEKSGGRIDRLYRGRSVRGKSRQEKAG